MELSERQPAAPSRAFILDSAPPRSAFAFIDPVHVAGNFTPVPPTNLLAY